MTYVNKISCNHGMESNFSCSDIFSDKLDKTIEHYYCHKCDRHLFRGKEYSREEWDEYIEDPDTRDY